MRPTFDIDFRVSEYLEAKAFPEYDRTPVPAPASARAAWNYRDDIDAINEAELALERGCGLNERHIHLATLAGRTPEQARVDAFDRFQRAYRPTRSPTRGAGPHRIPQGAGRGQQPAR